MADKGLEDIEAGESSQCGRRDLTPRMRRDARKRLGAAPQSNKQLLY